MNPRLWMEKRKLRKVQQRVQASEFWKWPWQGVSPDSLAPHLGAQVPHVSEKKMTMTPLVSQMSP